MKTVIVNQARMTSTRLPGKVLLEVHGKSLLEIQVERLRRCHLADDLVVATTTNPQDDAIEALCQRLGVACFRGDEMDVLSRYAGAVRMMGADWVLRVTSDCPLIDPGVLDEIIQLAQEAPQGCDYASNTLVRSFPRGLDGECFRAQALLEADREARLPGEREHVTPFLYRRPERYRLRSLEADRDCSQQRWTVDTPEDFELVSRLLGELLPSKPLFTWLDVLALMDARPDWFMLNRAIAQKEVQV